MKSDAYRASERPACERDECLASNEAMRRMSVSLRRTQWIAGMLFLTGHVGHWLPNSYHVPIAISGTILLIVMLYLFFKEYAWLHIMWFEIVLIKNAWNKAITIFKPGGLFWFILCSGLMHCAICGVFVSVMNNHISDISFVTGGVYGGIMGYRDYRKSRK